MTTNVVVAGSQQLRELTFAFAERRELGRHSSFFEMPLILSASDHWLYGRAFDDRIRRYGGATAR
jgi:hypothetical protein